MSAVLYEYRGLEEDLKLVRCERGVGSAVEDPILEAMSRLWWNLTDAERQRLDSEGPLALPAFDHSDDLGLEDVDSLATWKGPVRVRGAVNR